MPAVRFRVSRGVGFVGVSSSLVAFFVAAGAPTPLLPIYEHDWHFAAWILTLAFGVYAIALLVALLVIGSLSDYVGRRPLLIGALALELAAMMVFLLAGSVTWLIVGRIIQGIATGAASSAFGAAAVELAPEHRKKLGSLMVSLASTAGLAIGALFAGLVAQLITSAASFTVWLVLAIVMALGTLFALVTPETAPRSHGAFASMRPRIAVPRHVRRQFANTIPGMISAFMATALYLGLIPIIFGAVFSVRSPAIAGLAAFVLFSLGAVASVATGSVHPHRLKIYGNSALTIGAVLFIGSIATASFPLIWIATVFAGVGVGATFSGTVRGLVPEVRVHERAGLFAAIFIVTYLALGISAIVAGFFATTIGLTKMAIGFGATSAIVSVIAIALSAGLVNRESKTGKASLIAPRTTE